MTNRSHLKGNALIDVLALCIVIFLIYVLLITPYQAIDNEKNSELQSMLSSVKGSRFEPIFNSQMKDFMSDEKLSNKEFKELKVMFNSYQTSIISGSQEKFIESKSVTLKADNESNENSQKMGIFFLVCFLLGAFGIGLRYVLSS